MLRMDVPFFNWAQLYSERRTEFARIWDETAARGAFILQDEVAEFEVALAKFLGVKHVIALADCTNAMLLGLRACGLERGDEVILPSHGFIAAAQAVHFAGGVPVPVELSEHDWLLDPTSVEAAVTAKTRAIMPVHVNGRVCDMDPLRTIANEHGLLIVEDAAQAVGARYKGEVAASFGQWGAFSFYPSKTLGCFGDAGALATNVDTVAETVRSMRNHGADQSKSIPLDCAIWGSNCRMDNLHAAILTYKLSYYQEVLDRRRSIAARYDDALRDLEELRLPPAAAIDGDRFDIFQNYELRCRSNRDGLRSYLAERGVGTIVQWGGFGMHQLTGLGFNQKLPRTDKFFQEALLLPMNHLLSPDQVEHVIACVRDFFV